MTNDQMPEAQIRVSVIVPVYNAEFYQHEYDFLHVCLDSALNQTLREIEIICVFRQDGVSGPILEEYAKRDCRVRILLQTTQGMSAARNEGIAAARGDYLAFLDSDDFFIDPEALERLVSAGDREQAGIVGGLLRWAHMRDGVIESDEAHPLNRAGATPQGRVLRYAEHQYDFMFYCYLYSREFLLKHGILFPEDLTAGEDNLFHVKAMLTAEWFIAVSVEFYCWRTGHQIRSKGYIPERYLLKHNLDDLRSTLRMLAISKEHRLPWLHWMNARRINDRRQILLSIRRRDTEAIRLLLEAEALLDEEILALTAQNPPPPEVFRAMGIKDYADIPKKHGFRLYPLQSLFSDYDRGYWLIWPLRKLQGGLRCLFQNGFRYTIRRINQKIHGYLRDKEQHE